MIFAAARLAARDLFSQKSRTILWKSLGLTLVMLIALWFVLEAAVDMFLVPFLGPWPWAATIIVWLFGAGMFVGAAFLIAPVSAIFAGLFLDDIAQYVEKTYYGEGSVGQELPIGQSLLLSAKFFGVVLVANFIALLLILLPGINFVIFFVVNAYLLGREYFQFAAMRFRSEPVMQALYRQHKLTIFSSGMLIACFMLIPVLNLATPMFAGAMMTHLHKLISGEMPVLPNAATAAGMANFPD